jgi:hypothetical protein
MMSQISQANENTHERIEHEFDMEGVKFEDLPEKAVETHLPMQED